MAAPQPHTHLWLDDLRPAPDGWQWVETVEAAQALLAGGQITHASLDNDLGEGLAEGRQLVLWMAEQQLWPAEELRLHSANPVAVQWMHGTIARYGPYRHCSPDRRRFSR